MKAIFRLKNEPEFNVNITSALNFPTERLASDLIGSIRYVESRPWLSILRAFKQYNTRRRRSTMRKFTGFRTTSINLRMVILHVASHSRAMLNVKLTESIQKGNRMPITNVPFWHSKQERANVAARMSNEITTDRHSTLTIFTRQAYKITKFPSEHLWQARARTT